MKVLPIASRSRVRPPAVPFLPVASAADPSVFLALTVICLQHRPQKAAAYDHAPVSQ